ncbi:protein translocase subunit TIM13 NDAI_0D01940 [Naumovozyma dairenensis CBS 421]|uniref:Mitochondrial import inner membrane translocase subunit n=1 Tax=Naumovozyma dairenensis (strain ATCC 10597 / BCRC 20456 / CBS 421 / NBRC 0211 / NRRL Y-12639) TaxID=1071378 RepID=G0W9P7_NAUDC|nr:hypothetical protein NDAI_0D01940 [Naumovozyma dairenensis CBS 421]CCD24508.1 hypothetical protein NDAI_0D01940 [Naumovozyma dairenensis CBS 421]
MGFFSKSSSTSNEGQNQPKVESSPVANQIKTQIAQELAVANATELVSKLTENCFKKCLMAPYDSKNETCVDQCLTKYMKSWNAVSKAYVARIQEASTTGEI